MNVFSKSQGKMKKILEKSGKSQGILSQEKSGNPEYIILSDAVVTPYSVVLLAGMK